MFVVLVQVDPVALQTPRVVRPIVRCMMEDAEAVAAAAAAAEVEVVVVHPLPTLPTESVDFHTTTYAAVALILSQ